MDRDPFVAIADKTRREIIHMLSDTPLTINEITGRFENITRQAITKHIKTLEESGLLRMEKSGREKYCYVQLDNLIEVNEWLSYYEKFWNKKLDKLSSYLDKKYAKEAKKKR